MPSEAFNGIIAMLEASPMDVNVDTVELRATYEMMGSIFPVAEGVTIENSQVGGLGGQWHTPASYDEGRTVLYLHGGGYVIGSSTTHRSMVSHLATAACARVFAADYRLAPENPFPAAVDDAVAAYRGLIESGADPSQLIIAGDSAGGGLALATLVRLRDEGTVLPAGAASISPWVDLTQSGDSMRTFGDRDVLVKPATLDRWAALYCADSPADGPYASPLFADLSGLPPLLIHVGDQESLLDDARRLDERARAAGVDVELVIAVGMIHVWHFFAGSVPESDQAIADVGEWIIERTTQ